MNGRDEPAPSYDPRSWALRPADTVLARDPVAAHRGAGSQNADCSKAPPAGRRVRDQLIALGAGLIVAALGTVAASRAVPEAAPAAAPLPPPPTERVAQRILNVASAVGIPASLAALGLTADEADAAGAAAASHLKAGTGDLRLEVTLIDSARGVRLDTLVATHADGSGVAVDRTGDGTLTGQAIAAKLVRRLTFVRGELDGQSFYSSAVAAGVSDVLVGAFANAFQYDFDMQREVSRGDIFEAGFEQRVNASGRPVGSATLVYASLSTPAKTRALYRFQAGSTGDAGWYDSSGRSSRRALMRTPVEAARISSGFGMRGHPILGFVKMHRGTDFAAPTGTPIFAAGDATVSFAGPKGANGNFVRLRHDNGWDTLYLHMNRIAPGIAPGTRVLQGTQIGEVGTTGRSTGPHLHYEVHINGAPVDPLSIETGGGRTIAGSAAAAFRKIRDAIDTQRAAES